MTRWSRAAQMPGLLLVLLGAPSLPAVDRTVTSADDSGPNTLRQAITDANASGETDAIKFSIPGMGLHTITLASELPAIVHPVVIDGTTQPGYNGTPLIALDGNFKKNRSGLTLLGGGATVRGLAIGNFGSSGGTSPMYGLVIRTGGGNTVEACRIGTDAGGMSTARNTSGGILIDGSADNSIGGTTPETRNLISGNSGPGITITGAGAVNNVVQNNLIGLAGDGLKVLANFNEGVLLTAGASANRVGGHTPGARNAIAGNAEQVAISGGAHHNQVEGNYIGLRADGTSPFATPANGHGVTIRNAPFNNVGGGLEGAGNVISGNQDGVLVSGDAAEQNQIQGNFIGTTPSGTGVLANRIGVFLGSGARNNRIGGRTALTGNLISGNVNDGISINAASDNVIEGNLIGTDITGTQPLGNARPGNQSAGISLIGFSGPCQNNVIGGNQAEARNVISGNQYAGVVVAGGQAAQNSLLGNFIGTTVNGDDPLGNAGDGVLVLGGIGTRVGGAANGEGNVIAANGGVGVEFAGTFGAVGAPSSDNTLVGNLVGLGIPRDAGLPPPAPLVLVPGGPLLQGSAATADALQRFFNPEISILNPSLFNGLGGFLNTYGDNNCVGAPGIAPGNAFGCGGGKAALKAVTGSRWGDYANVCVTPDGSPWLDQDPGVNPAATVPEFTEATYTAPDEIHFKGRIRNGPPATRVAVTVYVVYSGFPNRFQHPQRTLPLTTLDLLTDPQGNVEWTGTASGPILPGEDLPQLKAVATYDQKTSSGASAPIVVTPGGSLSEDSFSLRAPVVHCPFGGNCSLHVRRTVGKHAAAHAVLTIPAQSRSTLPSPLLVSDVVIPVDFPAPGINESYQDVTVTTPFPIVPNQSAFTFLMVQLTTPQAGATIAEPATWLLVIDPPPAKPDTLQLMPGDGELQVEWEGYGALYWTTDLNSEFTLVPGVSSPAGFPMAGLHSAFFKLADIYPHGTVTGHVGNLGGYVIQAGDAGPVTQTQTDGAFTVPGVPAGTFDVLVYRRTLVVEPATGKVETFLDAVPVEVEVAEGGQASIEIQKVEFSGRADRPPCGCTPWCGIIAGTVNGIPQVSAFGGAQGPCSAQATVTISAPDGTEVTNPARRKIFKPAGNGTWTVTSAVCGITKTCTIALP
jgi:hypothetical protein